MPSIAQTEYGIKDVWSSNFEEEFRKIRQIIQVYKYVAMVSKVTLPENYKGIVAFMCQGLSSHR